MARARHRVARALALLQSVIHYLVSTPLSHIMQSQEWNNHAEARVTFGQNLEESMSRVLGVKIVTGVISIVMLGGTRSHPEYLNHRRIVIPDGHKPSECVNWAESQFENLLTAEKPEIIVYRLTTGLEKHDQIFKVYFNLGVLNLVAYKHHIIANHLAPQSARPPAFGLSKNGNINEYLKAVLGDHPPYWNGDMLEAAAGAFLGLPK